MTEMMRLKIKEWITEENADHEKYCTAAKDFSTDSKEIAGILKDIAAEEATHAKALEYILRNFG